jgi:hypothetical protein
MMMGLGTDFVIDSSGATIDCDSWANLFNSSCWGMGGPSALPAGVQAPTCSLIDNLLGSGQCAGTSNSTGTIVIVGGIAVAALIGFVMLSKG